MNLALKYRPKTFDEVVGQKAISIILKAMVTKGSLDQVLLFTGPSGVGKTSMARIIAASLNPTDADLVHSGSHPAVLEIDAASNGSVERIRQLKTDLNYSIPGHRVIVLDEAHAISDEGKTALLNILEFTPKNVTFILLTTEINKIPVAVRHRCDQYKFKLASVVDLSERLRYVADQENISISDELVNLIAQRSEGSFRESLMILQQLNAAGITSIEEYNELQGEIDFGPSLIDSTLYGPSIALGKLENILRYSSATEVVERTVETLRDLILIKGKLPVSFNGVALDSRQRLAEKLSQASLIKAIRLLWDVETKLKGTDTTRSLEMAFSLMGDMFKPEEPIAVASNNRLSLEKMRSLQG